MTRAKYQLSGSLIKMPHYSRFRCQAEADAAAMILGGYKSVPHKLPNGRTVMRDVPDERFIDRSLEANERRVCEYLGKPLYALYEDPSIISTNKRAILRECKYVTPKAYRAVLERAQYMSTYERPESVGENPFK